MVETVAYVLLLLLEDAFHFSCPISRQNKTKKNEKKWWKVKTARRLFIHFSTSSSQAIQWKFPRDTPLSNYSKLKLLSNFSFSTFVNTFVFSAIVVAAAVFVVAVVGRAPFVCLAIRSFFALILKILEKRLENIFHFGCLAILFSHIYRLHSLSFSLLSSSHGLHVLGSNALIFIYFIILKIHWECSAQCVQWIKYDSFRQTKTNDRICSHTDFDCQNCVSICEIH